MIRISLIALLLVACTAPLGCTSALGDAASDDDGDEDGHDGFAPFDDRENELLQGVYDCTERNDTGYRQGSSFPIQVVTVDGKPVEGATANSYLAMQEAARGAGISLRIVSGFRTMEQQEYFYGCYVNCNCNSCNLAARPGYSNHQSGHALDLNTADAGVLTWLNNNGARFGWSRTVPSEAWHWEWWGDAADFDGPCGAPPTPAGCRDGSFAGDFCDDDDSSSQAAHECLQDLLHDEGAGDFRCADIDGQPAYCGDQLATRAEALFTLARAAGMPLVDDAGAAFPDAFVDDAGHRFEATLNAGNAFGILRGDGAGHANPDGGATRSTIAVLLTRIYGLPPATQDYFSDDDGTTNEDFHNRIAALGFTYGCGAGDGGRRRFCGDERADRSALARFSCGAAGYDAVAVWDRPPPPNPDEPAPTDPAEPSDPEDRDPPDHTPGPPPDGVDDEAPPESEPGTADSADSAGTADSADSADSARALDLPPAVVHEEGCAQRPSSSAGSSSALMIGLLLLLRRRRC